MEQALKLSVYSVKARRNEEFGGEAPMVITPRAVVRLARRLARLLRGRASRGKR